MPRDFDVLIMSEVLKHLVDPVNSEPPHPLDQRGRHNSGKLLEYLSHGCDFQIVAGHFDYQDSRMMDRTHLRWFTPTSFSEILNSAGVRIDSVGPVSRPREFRQAIDMALPAQLKHLLWY